MKPSSSAPNPPEQGQPQSSPGATEGKGDMRAVFVTGSTMRHVVVMTLSGSVGLGFMFLVDFLALYWVSRLNDVSLLAAVGFATMVQFLVISISLGMMIAGVALVARSLGAGQGHRARDYATTSLILSTATQTIVASLAWIYRDPFLALTGAEGEVLQTASELLKISLLSLPLIALGVNAGGLLRAAGDAWRSMLVTLIAGIVIMVLDPLLILYSGYGVMGVAYSIVISRIVMAAIGLYWLIVTHRLLARPSLSAIRGMARPYFSIAIPSVGTQMSTPLGQWILTIAIAPFGPEAVAGLAVSMRIGTLVFGGIYGLAGAIGGIIGQNFGAKRLDRVRRAFLDALIFCSLYTLVAWAILGFGAGLIVDSFGLTGDGARVVVIFCQIITGTFFFVGGLFVAASSFNNLGKPLWAMLANWLHDIVLIYPVAVGLGAYFGAAGAVMSLGIANVIAGLGAAWLAYALIQRLLRANPPVLPG